MWAPQTHTVSHLQIKVYTVKSFFLFLNQNICCGYSKEPSQWDGSIEHPKHKFKLMGKEINAILGAQMILIWTYEFVSYLLLYKTICCGHSKEPSQWDGSIEHTQHKFKFMSKEINAILGAQTILIWTYEFVSYLLLYKTMLPLFHPLVQAGWLLQTWKH